MQTFMPYPGFVASLRVLDNARLGKQRLECKQILAVLTGETVAYASHPAVAMWRGYEEALLAYARTACEEWMARGFDDNLLDHFSGPAEFLLPPWMGDVQFHASHRSNLLRKDVRHYQAFDWKENPSWAYLWPTPQEERGAYTLRLSRPDIKRIIIGDRTLPGSLADLIPKRPIGKYEIPTITRRNEP